MKGILLAGGLGSRLYPTTRVVNKHLLPLYDRPMFYWPLQTLIDSGIKEIAVVSGPPTGEQVKQSLEFFPKKNIQFTFVTQDEPCGMPHAIYQCKQFLGRDSFIVSVGDNLFGNNFEKEVGEFKTGAAAMIRRVKDPSAFGVALFDENKKVLDIIEKPKSFVSPWAVGAPYIFDESAITKIECLKPSKRGELEIVDLLKLYMNEGSLHLIKKTGVWIDTGTPENLLKAGLAARQLLRNRSRSAIF